MKKKVKEKPKPKLPKNNYTKTERTHLYVMVCNPKADSLTITEKKGDIKTSTFVGFVCKFGQNVYLFKDNETKAPFESEYEAVKAGMECKNKMAAKYGLKPFYTFEEELEIT